MRKRKKRKFGFFRTIIFLAFIVVVYNFLRTRYNESKYYVDSPLDSISEIFSQAFTNPDYKTDNKRALKRNLQQEADGGNDKARWIVDNFDYLDDNLIYLAGNDSDAIDFAYNYSNNITDFEHYQGVSVDYGRRTPYFLQWDNRWAYDYLGGSVLGLAGCGPTSMAMVIARLEGDTSIDPGKIALDAQNYMTDDGIAWKFFNDEANIYGYTAYDISNDEGAMIDALEKGPLIVSVNKGIFTLFGHILVIDSYQDGKFVINDPNSMKKSEKSWSYDEIKDQIAHIWLIN